VNTRTRIQTSNNSSINIHKQFLNNDTVTFLIKYYKKLPYFQDNYNFNGNIVQSPRLICYMGVKNYFYSGINHVPIPFDNITKTLLDLIVKLYPYQYNGCLINYYRNGNDSIGMHTDNESCIDLSVPIINLSLGSNRTLIVKDIKTNEKHKILMESGSLIGMIGDFQQDCIHGIAKEKNILTPRISITFRRFK